MEVLSYESTSVIRTFVRKYFRTSGSTFVRKYFRTTLYTYSGSMYDISSIKLMYEMF